MTKPKQTSSAVSSIAAKYVRMKNFDMEEIVYYGTSAQVKAFFRDFRKVCASALAQDQTKGQK
jgi:hypothetical protein